jgi:hypothetical protein
VCSWLYFTKISNNIFNNIQKHLFSEKYKIAFAENKSTTNFSICFIEWAGGCIGCIGGGWPCQKTKYDFIK